jgi:hypothetical protein
MDKRTIIIGTVLLNLLIGCGSRRDSRKNDQDTFYTVTGGWDWVRVPLLKPYEVKKADPEIETNDWGIEFINSFGTYNVKRVDVKDSIVFILSGKVDNKNDSTIVNSQNVPTAWFVIDTKRKTEKGFASEEAFKSYIKDNNYPRPRWHDIDSLSKALANGSKVPWMPK